jgi:hypothetical protein
MGGAHVSTNPLPLYGIALGNVAPIVPNTAATLVSATTIAVTLRFRNA